ncbi:MAG: SEC-C metal-binding domain-containing protein [Sulfuritalea sp.]|nr:SEC-C metal-binding domain-containing protein [Sulfuritalea sp.]
MIADAEHSETADLDALLRMGVHEALAGTDFKNAFESFLAELPRQTPGFMTRVPAGAERAIGLALFREIWNHTPRPDLGWKRLTLPKPERNAPCPCGSGRKYKQCCAPSEGTSPFPGGFTVLRYVLETVPVASYGNLPFRQLDPEEVAHVASEWQTDGRIEPATLLLEALLAHGSKLDSRHEYAFDTLCELYLDAGRGDQRLALVERFMQAQDKRLRAAAWQRRATLHADNGEHARAWEVFKEAQRLDPDNPSLAHLELVLLANQDRYDEARTRAAFWAKRLVKLGYADEPIVDLMEDVARDPEVLRAMLAGHDGDWDAEDWDAEATPEDLDLLERMIETLPAPSCQHRLSPQDDAAGPLQASPELAAVEQEWDDIYWGDAEERNPWSDARWLGWLADHPLAWQSFDVIEDLVGILGEDLFPEDADDRLERMEDTLLDHALALLRRVLADNRAEGLSFEWGWMENRPALRLLLQKIDMARYSHEELPLLEWLVLTLNPNDNGGQRERLVHAYCEAGRPANALAVCDRYPGDDLAGILYGRVLALYLLGRRGDAVAALAHAAKRLPKVFKTLVAARPKTPPLMPGIVTHGGDDEAWRYRVTSLETWLKCQALDWLKETAGRKP